MYIVYCICIVICFSHLVNFDLVSVLERDPMVNISCGALILTLIMTAGCQAPISDQLLGGFEVSPPKKYESALESAPQPSTSYLLLRMDGSPIDGSENQILVCTPKKEICIESCISIYRPEIERWSIFKTDYLNGGKCVAYALAYSNGVDVPRAKYWLGEYKQNYGRAVTGTCAVNAANPTYEGRSFFNFVRIQSPNYYLHNFFDNAGRLTGSVRLLNFLPPAMWSYHDSTVTNADITPQLVSGFSCIKEHEIFNAFN